MLTIILFISSCGRTSQSLSTIDKDNIQATMIEVELMDSGSLFILLAKDGTINRKGDLKTPDKNFFMGITKENLFDKLIQVMPNELSSYNNKVHVLADTTKSVNKIKIGFSRLDGDNGFEYYTDEPIDKLPKPIQDFINSAIQITDPWFNSQQKMTKPQ